MPHSQVRPIAYAYQTLTPAESSGVARPSWLPGLSEVITSAKFLLVKLHNSNYIGASYTTAT